MDSSTVSYEGLQSDIVTCSLCWHERQQKEAKIFCKHCLKFLCESCDVQHDRFPAMRHHSKQEVADLTDETHRKVVGSRLGEDNDVTQGGIDGLDKCGQHPECLINMFCEDHTSPCCARCAYELHKDCTSVIPDLVEVSRNITHSDSYHENITTMKQHLTQLKKVKDRHNEEINKSKAEKARIGQEIDDFYDDLINKISAMKTSMITEMDDIFTREQNKFTDKLVGINNIINTVERYLKQLEELHKDEVRCYINYRKGREIADNLTHVMERSSLEVTRNTIKLTRNDTLTKFLSTDSNKLGELIMNDLKTSDTAKKTRPVTLVSPYKYPWLPVGGVFH